MATITCGLAQAKDLTRLWYAGGSLAFHTTQDEIGSNADMRMDPRPDDFVSREIAIEDTIRFDLTAGFGFTKWFSLQLDVGYFEGDVGPLEAYLTDTFPVSRNPLEPVNLSGFENREEVVPLSSGRIAEIPVTLSGIVRFRTDRPLNPYIGAGAGIIFTEIETSAELESLNRRLSNLRITGVVNENQLQITPPEFQALRGDGRIPFTFPVRVDAEDAHALHVLAGLEYFLGDRVSFVADARYTFADRSVSIQMAGEDQIDLLIYSEMLFRPDGSLKIFNDRGAQPNPFLDPNVPELGRVQCTPNTTEDFDFDGHEDDLCYHDNINSRQDDPRGVFVIQGGDIDLSGFSFHLGVRFAF